MIASDMAPMRFESTWTADEADMEARGAQGGGQEPYCPFSKVTAHSDWLTNLEHKLIRMGIFAFFPYNRTTEQK
jgi:hypothetical protein